MILKNMKEILKNWNQPGGLKEVFIIAFPIFMSNAIDTIMIFTDRYFLAELGREHLGATMAGGLAAFLIAFFLIGTLGQVTAFVAQYYGARDYEKCSTVVDQGILLTVFFSIPLIAIGWFFGEKGFYLAGHRGLLLKLEVEYFNILVLMIFTGGLRASLSGFFTGIGKTNIVMWTNLLGVIINIPLSYILIFGQLGAPTMGIRGAAWGTIIAGFVPILGMGIVYLSSYHRSQYVTHLIPKYRWNITLRLLRFGLPSGTEAVLNILAFTIFMLVIQSISVDAAAAITIILNWDLVSALPVLGIGQAAMSLVGKYKGAGRLDLSRRAAWSSMGIAWIYSTLITIVYLTFTSELTGLFSSSSADVNYSGVYVLADTMLRLSCFYITFDATYIVFSSVIRGAGDTRFALIASVLNQWIFTFVTVYLINAGYLGVIGGWGMLILLVVSMAFIYFLRFQSGKWMHIKMIDEVVI